MLKRRVTFYDRNRSENKVASDLDAVQLVTPQAKRSVKRHGEAEI